MADLKITTLPALAEAGIQATDPLAIADVSATETKKVTVKDLIAAGVALIDDGDIPAAKVGTLGTNQVASAAIQAGAVVAAKIASGTITATQIADATITGAKLVNDTVTATQIAANAITASELADDAVDTAAIAANAVTTAKITDANVTYAKLSLSDGDIPGAKIATGGITATQLAANSVTASELADNAVDTAAIVDGAVTAVKIATNTITANQIAANAIGASELADNAVDTAAIADGAVTAAKLSGTLAATSIADNAVTTAKILDDAVTSAKLAANAVDAAALADNAVDSGAIASSAVIEAKIASNAVTVTKIADGTITPAKLNTSNLDRSLNVASGNLGINNTITAATRSGITYNAQGLITGTVALVAGDLPVATTSAVGGVSIGTGLSVSGAGALSLTNSVTGATVSGITFNNQGMITAATGLVAGDLPVATTSAKGAVQITSGGGLTVDGSGNLTTSTSGVSAGTYQSVTVNNKGVITAGAALTAGLIPDLAASKITSGSLDAARIANDSIDGSKLSNSSTALFQSIAQAGYPTAQFSGQILFDTVSEDAYIWDGNAWQAITTLTKGSLVFGGNFNANTSKMTACTSAGLAAGLAVGSNLPTPSSTTDGLYVVVDTAGTPSAPAPVVAFSPPDYILGVTNASGSSWNEIDLSQTVAGQVASNITFTPYGQLSSTNVQDALQELETEKLALAGGTVTGQVLIGNTGSLVFEGSTIDAYETTITVADPTSSDKTITFPDTTGTVITTGDTGTVTGTMLANDTIQNVDIKSDAAIAFSKLAALTSAQILVGNGSNVATAVAVTGDISINNAGLTSIAAGAIVNADINASAAIAGSKITTGTTSAVGVLQLTDSATSTSATTAATPAAVKIAKDAADAAATTANAALPKAGGTMTGNLILDNAKELRLSEGDSDGANYTGLKAQAQTGDITLTLPAVAPTAGQVLKADASTPTTLTWAADSATDSTKMPLAGGTFTGDVTFTGDSSNGLWDKSASAFVANLTGTASIATSITVADESSDTTCFPLFATAATGNLGAKSGSNLTFNSSSGALTATSFVGALTGDVTGNVSGTALTVTQAAQSAITSLGVLTTLTNAGGTELRSDVHFNNGTNAGKDIYWDESDNALEFSDDVKVVFGDDSDLQIYHDGSSSTIYENGTGPLNIQTNNSNINIKGGGSAAHNMAIFKSTEGVELYYNNVKTLATQANGITVLGPEGGSAQINLYSDEGDDNADLWRIDNKNDGTFAIENYTSGSWETNLKLTGNAGVHLYHDNSAVCYTDTDALRFNDDKYLKLGSSQDLQIFHNGSTSIIDSTTSNLDIQSNNTINIKAADQSSVIAHASGAVELFHNNVRTLFTRNNGIEVIGPNTDAAIIGLNADNGDDNADKWQILAAADGVLAIRNYSTGSWVNGLTLDGSNNATINGATTLDSSSDQKFILKGSNDPYIHFKEGSTDKAYIQWHSDGYVYIANQESGRQVRLGGSAGLEEYDGSAWQQNVHRGNAGTLPLNSKNGAYTLVASDSGKAIDQQSGGWTINNSVFSAGDMVTLINNSGSDQTITQGSGLTIYNTADATTGNRTLAGRGMATLIFLSASNCYISGAGLS